MNLNDPALRNAVLAARTALKQLYALTEGTELAVGTEDILDPFDAFTEQFELPDVEAQAADEIEREHLFGWIRSRDD